eukprot:gb/GEZJ01005756.1/.p2 GENE.gb/GEZJ01005756.1/~~gb/GEZJ01005756.1/.p2  ORF type:complete len:110 (+),score=5.30 gb/GEZJ01005756.1/:382-711(+)
MTRGTMPPPPTQRPIGVVLYTSNSRLLLQLEGFIGILILTRKGVTCFTKYNHSVTLFDHMLDILGRAGALRKGLEWSFALLLNENLAHLLMLGTLIDSDDGDMEDSEYY